MKKKLSFARANAHFVAQHSKWIVLAIVLISLLGAPFVSRLKLKANFLDLLSTDTPSIENLHKLTDEVGGTSYLIVAIESSDEKTAEKATNQFLDKAKTFQEIEYVDDRTNLDAFENRKLLFLNLESVKKLDKKVKDLMGYYRRKNNPFFVDLLDEQKPELNVDDLEPEQKIYRVGGFAAKEKETFMKVILLKPKHPLSDFVGTERMLSASETALAEIQTQLSHPVTFGLTGPYKTRYDEYQLIQSDLTRTGAITFVLVLIIMLAFFKKRRSVLFAFSSLGIGIFWTCVYAQIAIGYLNLITAFLLAILIGLGIDFAIHFLVTFQEERKHSSNMEEILEKTFRAIGEPLLTSALTTSIAFFSLTISKFQGFSHFGKIAGVGILLCFVAILYGLPSLILVSEKLFPQKEDEFESKPTKWPELKPGPIYSILLICFLFTGFAVAQIPKVQFEYSFKKLQEKGAPAIELAERIGGHFGVVLNPVALMMMDRKQANALAKQINDHIVTHPETTFDFAVSIESQVPQHQEEKIKILAAIEQRLAKQESLLEHLDDDVKKKINSFRKELHPTSMKITDLPRGVLRQYEGKDGNVSIVYVYPNQSILDGQVAQRFIKEIKALQLPKNVILAGEPVVYTDILFLLEQDTPRAMAISLGVVVLLLFFHFRLPHHVLWVLAPVLIGFLWLMGLAGLTQFKFNYMNMVILPSILGVGIDNGIYIFHRYQREKKSTMFGILHKTGKAVIVASLTTMAAFASLLFARHQGMASMGELGLLGFAACLGTSVLFIPALVEFFEQRYWHPWDRSKKTSNF